MFNRIKNTVEISFNQPDSKDVHKVLVSKKIPLLKLKEIISEVFSIINNRPTYEFQKIGLSLNEFKVMKESYSGNVELKNEEDSLDDYNLTNGTKLVIEKVISNYQFIHFSKGKPLRKGEIVIKFVYFDPNAEGQQVTDLFKLPIPGGVTVKEAKDLVFLS